jgi:hypothetical protein
MKRMRLPVRHSVYIVHPHGNPPEITIYDHVAVDRTLNR